MAISFSCPQCGRDYQVADDGLAGRRVKCKQCATLISIPHPDPPVEEGDDEGPADLDLRGMFEDEAEAPPTPTFQRTASPFKKGKKRKNKQAAIIGGLIAGAVGVLVVAGLLIW